VDRRGLDLGAAPIRVYPVHEAGGEIVVEV
jgi:hypothetical protein